MPPTTEKTLYLVFLGPPGSGKGTQAKKIIDKYHVFHLSSGDLLREIAATGSDLGKKVKAIMDRGELVPDHVLFEIFEEKLKSPDCKHGVIFDGFPRNIAQAEELEKMMHRLNRKFNCVIEFRVPDQDLVDRITGRLVHLPSGRTYNIKFNPPKVPMKDDVTGEPLTQRKDDNVEVLKERLKVYHSQTAPLIEFYEKKKLLSVVDASKSLDEVSQAVFSAISKSI